MKLLSDFDGVWTDPVAEASAQGEFLEQSMLSWLPESDRLAAVEWLAQARARIRAAPSEYGWAPGGRLSAFGDEDPFAVHSALLHYLHVHATEDRMARTFQDAVTAHGFADLEAFGGHAHAKAVERVARERGPGVLAAAAGAGRRLLAAEVDVVVVSNSTTDKLSRWFAHAEVPAQVHPAHAPGALRLRGAARKFVLDPAARDPLRLSTVSVEAARPSYEGILRDERPDAVVGDVFSLDLALPLVLRRRDAGFRHMRLFWLVHPYTPAWLQREIEGSAPEIEAVGGGLAALADLLLSGASAR